MRFFLLLLFATVCGYGALQIGRLDPDNYVKMYIGNYVVEVKVLGFLLLILGLVIVLYCLLRLAGIIWKAPKSYSKWRDKHETLSAEAALGAGYLSLIKGDWRRAEKLLTTKSKHSHLPYINYLAAAQAAQEQGKLVARDEYLNAAYQAAPKERLAIGLIKARLHQSSGQLDQALATLEDIADDGAKNAQFTAMLMQTYQQMGNWSDAQKLLPRARKQQALPNEELASIYNNIHSSNLTNATDIKAAWKALPRDQKRREANIMVYASELISQDEGSDAERVIRGALKLSWSEPLVHLYGCLPTAKPAKLRRRVDGWLLARPESAALNLAAGRLSMAAKDYDAAKEYFQKAIQLAQSPEAYALLGELFEATNDSAKALQLYRAGVRSLVKSSETESRQALQSVADGGGLTISDNSGRNT